MFLFFPWRSPKSKHLYFLCRLQPDSLWCMEGVGLRWWKLCLANWRGDVRKIHVLPGRLTLFLGKLNLLPLNSKAEPLGTEEALKCLSVPCFARLSHSAPCKNIAASASESHGHTCFAAWKGGVLNMGNWIAFNLALVVYTATVLSTFNPIT